MTGCFQDRLRPHRNLRHPRSVSIAAWPRVTMSRPGSLPYRARSGHDWMIELSAMTVEAA